MRRTKPKYVSVVNGTDGTSFVEHEENGILIEGVDSPAAAQAIAILANLGNLCRTDDGYLCINPDADPDNVTTLEQFMEDFEDSHQDDGPQDDTNTEFDEDAYGPLEEAIGE